MKPLALALFTISAATPAIASGPPYTFEYVTGHFDSPGAVTAENLPPAFDGQTVAFFGFDRGRRTRGMFTFPLGGTVHAIAEEGDPSPGGGIFATMLEPPSISDGAIAFDAATSTGRGIFTNYGGSLQAVIGPGYSELPDGGADRNWGPRPAIQGGTVLYATVSDFGRSNGIFSWSHDGGGRTVVDIATPNPGDPGRPFLPVSWDPALHDGLVAFASFGNPGIFVFGLDGHIVQTVANTHTPAPGGSGNFARFDPIPLDLDQGAVVFEATSETAEGLYTNLGGVLRLVAGTDTAIPGGHGNFLPFNMNAAEFALSSVGVVFRGFGPGSQQALYGDFAGSLERIIGAGDMLDGGQITQVIVGRDGLVGNRLVFTAFFANGQTGIYVVTVPAPTGLVCIGLAAAGACRRARRPG